MQDVGAGHPICFNDLELPDWRRYFAGTKDAKKRSSSSNFKVNVQYEHSYPQLS